MTWKEFIRPNLKKISFAILFAIVEFILFFISGAGALCKMGVSCYDNWYNAIAKILSIHTYSLVRVTESWFNNPLINILTIMLINLIIGYLIACIVFYFLDRNKK